MSTIVLRDSIEIDRSAADVWRVVADYRRDPEWRTGVITMAPTPDGLVGPRTTTAEQLRLGGRTWHNAGEVTSVDPGVRFTWRTTSGADADGARLVEVVGPDRCRVRMELNVRPRGAERLMAPVLRRMLRRNLARDLARLRDLAALEPAPT